MVQTEENKTSQKPKNNTGVFIIGLLVLVLALFVVYVTTVYRGILPPLPAPEVKNQALEKIGTLEIKLSNLQEKLSDLENKVERTAKLNTTALEDKASVQTVTEMESKIESLKEQVSELSKYSSTGALILTASLMVKETAQKGEPFVYEAEVLRLLAEGTNMAQTADTIFAYAEKGVPSVLELQNSFKELYAQENTPQEQTPATAENTSWKDKLNAKLNTLVSIEYNNKQAPERPEMPDEVYPLVEKAHFSEALQKIALNPKYQTEKFQAWEKSVSERLALMNALQNIEAQTLALMKKESLKNQN